MLPKAAMPFNFSSPEYLSHHRTRKNRVSPVSRASPAHMNSPLKIVLYLCRWAEYCSVHVNEPGYSSGNENSDNELGYSSGNENSDDILVLFIF